MKKSHALTFTLAVIMLLWIAGFSLATIDPAPRVERQQHFAVIFIVALDADTTLPIADTPAIGGNVVAVSAKQGFFGDADALTESGMYFYQIQDSDKLWTVTGTTVFRRELENQITVFLDVTPSAKRIFNAPLSQEVTLIGDITGVDATDAFQHGLTAEILKLVQAYDATHGNSGVILEISSKDGTDAVLGIVMIVRQVEIDSSIPASALDTLVNAPYPGMDEKWEHTVASDIHSTACETTSRVTVITLDAKDDTKTLDIVASVPDIGAAEKHVDDASKCRLADSTFRTPDQDSLGIARISEDDVLTVVAYGEQEPDIGTKAAEKHIADTVDSTPATFIASQDILDTAKTWTTDDVQVHEKKQTVVDFVALETLKSVEEPKDAFLDPALSTYKVAVSAKQGNVAVFGRDDGLTAVTYWIERTSDSRALAEEKPVEEAALDKPAASTFTDQYVLGVVEEKIEILTGIKVQGYAFV